MESHFVVICKTHHSINKTHVLLKLMFHTTSTLCMNIIFIQSIDVNLLSIFLNIRRTSNSKFNYKKICANCKVCSLLSFLYISSITIINRAMDFIVSIASLCNSSLKVSIIFQDSINFLKVDAMSPLNYVFCLPQLCQKHEVNLLHVYEAIELQYYLECPY